MNKKLPDEYTYDPETLCIYKKMYSLRDKKWVKPKVRTPTFSIPLSEICNHET